MDWFFKRSHSSRYETLAKEEESDGEVYKEQESRWKTSSRRRLGVLCTALVLSTLLALFVFSIVTEKYRILIITASGYQSGDAVSFPVCTNPPLRREWRQLSANEKNNYIAAVKCFQISPSRLNANDTLYDDFPRVHSQIGTFAHDAATFLSWHRHFIYLYEKTLRESCGYSGYMPYWDWPLDFVDPAKSPVFDSEFGFGGNGNPNAPEAVGSGHCVTEGPFSDLRPKYYDNIFENPNDELLPRCLSRGFADGDTFSGDLFSPEVMKELFSKTTFDDFLFYLERTPHNGIPLGIRGDFLTYTAPYDPLFYLHHTQIDRLWWLWQQGNPNRKYAYSGRRDGSKGSANATASLSDVLPYLGLGRDVTVSEVMTTKSELLCYRY